jgi:hypothetical protein
VSVSGGNYSPGTTMSGIVGRVADHRTVGKGVPEHWRAAWGLGTNGSRHCPLGLLSGFSSSLCPFARSLARARALSLPLSLLCAVALRLSLARSVSPRALDRSKSLSSFIVSRKKLNFLRSLWYLFFFFSLFGGNFCELRRSGGEEMEMVVVKESRTWEF